jgi:hypothetical protein
MFLMEAVLARRVFDFLSKFRSRITLCELDDSFRVEFFIDIIPTS